MVIVSFPKRLKYSKINPLEDFYSKCMKTLQECQAITGVIDSNLAGVQVWAFSINQKDYTKLTELVKKHVKKQYPELPFKKIKFNVGMIMLDIGPRVDNTVKIGKVKINLNELYENRNDEDKK